MVLEGRLADGLGRGAAFTRLDWVRCRLMDTVGIDPFPGTLNLTLDDDSNLARWRQWQDMPGHSLERPIPASAGRAAIRCR